MSNNNHLPHVFRPTAPFDARDFLAKVGRVARAEPELAPRAFANAALRLRYEAAKPENRANWQYLRDAADRLDEASEHAEEMIGESDADVEGELDAQDNGDLAAAFMQQKTLEAQERGQIGTVITPDGQIAFGIPEGEEIKQSRINPASARPGLTMFGNQALVQFGASPASNVPAGTIGFASTGISALQEAQCVRWDGKEQDCTLVTISVSRNLQGAGATFPAATNPAGSNFGYRPFFRVLWGTSRTQPNEVIGDVAMGVQFTVACSFLYCNVGMDASVNSPIWGAEGSMVLAAQMAFFGAGRSSPITRTQYIDSLTAGSVSTSRIIPSFARSLLPIQTSERNTGAALIIWSDAAANVIMRSELLLPGGQTAPIPIPNDAYSYTLTNTGTATAFFRLMWELSL